MAALKISVDGVIVSTVSTGGKRAIAIRVSGTGLVKQFSSLWVDGDVLSKDGEASYSTWVPNMEIQPGQTVKVQLLDVGETWPVGRTIDEMFPPDARMLMDVSGDILANLREPPTRRLPSSYQISCANRASSGTVNATHHSFGFTVVWHSTLVDQAQVTFYTCKFEDVVTAMPKQYLFHDTLKLGQSAIFCIDA